MLRSLRSTIRRWPALGALFALAALAAVPSSVLAAPMAAAADVDLVVNVSTPRSVVAVDDVVTYVVRVDNRGTVAANGPATVSLTVPNTAGSTVAWESSVTCTASGGATCPSGFTRSGSTIQASIPAVPVAGGLRFDVAAPGNPNSYVSGTMRVTATVATAPVDADARPETDESFVNVLVTAADVRYDVASTGPAAASAMQVVSYDVVVGNRAYRQALALHLSVAGDVGTATATTTPLSGLSLRSVTCLTSTGGASCANLLALGVTDAPLTPQPASVVTAGATSARIGVPDMPEGSTVTLRFDVLVGHPACNDAAGGAFRGLRVVSAVGPLSDGAYEDDPAQNADNDAIAFTNVAVPSCIAGDLAAVTMAQPAGQAASGVAIGGAFAYDVEYANLAATPATGATIEFGVTWPAAAGATLAATPVCVATGGATCPTVWTVTGSSIVGTGADLPAGAGLTVTYAGVGGGDDRTVCRPQGMLANTRIVPPDDVRDVNYVASAPFVTGAQSHGNNGRQVATQTDVGSPCTDSHDDVAQQLGPYSDPDATVPVSGPIVPGQVVYFRTSFTSATPAPDLVSYAAGATASIPTSSGVLDTADPDRGWRHQGNDPAGLAYRDDDASFGALTVPFDTGVRCVASAGATCPVEIGSIGASGGGGARWLSGWSTYWKPATQPSMPSGAELTFISSYRVPRLSPLLASGCVPDGVSFGTAGTSGTVATTTFSFSVTAATNPATVDRNQTNDQVSVQYPLQITRCDQTLSVAKTALTPTMPLDRRVSYRIVARNTSASALDLPRIIDLSSPDAPATIACTATTDGASCPTFVPTQGRRRLADGSEVPSDVRLSSSVQPASFDFVWGTAGAATMPPGSSVTFEVTVQLPLTYTGVSANTVVFTGDQSSTSGRWPAVRAGAAVTSTAGSALAIVKRVDPVNPRPGQVVRFSVDVVNGGAPVSLAHFTDLVDAVLRPQNPDGFADVQCRSITAADDVLDPRRAVGTTACPTVTSTSDGLRADIADFATNSGLRFSYTAVAPIVSGSIPNLATITQNDAHVTTGDASSKVNLYVATASVSGTVWHDRNGSAAGTFGHIDDPGEPGTNLDSLYAVLVDDATGEVIAVVAVNPDGTYRFDAAPVNTAVTVIITTENPAPGTVPGTPRLPGDWTNTSPLRQVSFSTGVGENPGKDFGVREAPPSTDPTGPTGGTADEPAGPAGDPGTADAGARNGVPALAFTGRASSTGAALAGVLVMIGTALCAIARRRGQRSGISSTDRARMFSKPTPTV